MNHPPVVNNVLIIAGDADGNLGDKAILYSICDQLKIAKPDLRIAVVSNSDAIKQRDNSIVTLRSGLSGFARLVQEAVRADAIICGGGGLFQDDNSLIKMPYWALRVVLMRLCCRRVFGYSLGVGPLRAFSSRWSARLAFLCMRSITTRDPLAQATAQQLTRKPVRVIPDPAFLLEAAPADEVKQRLQQEGVPNDVQPLIGVAVRRWFPPRARLIPHRIAARFRPPNKAVSAESARLCDLFAAVLDRLVEKHNATIVFLPTYIVAHESDDRLCEEIQRRMQQDPGTIVRIDNPQLYKGVCAQIDVLLGGRMHPTIFAAAAGTSIVGLAYNQKFQGMFNMLRLGESVIDVQDFVAGEMTGELESLVNKALNKKLDITEHLAETKRSIRDFNRQILGHEA